MVWISRRNMMLGTFHAKRGKVVPDKVINELNPGRMRSLTNVGHLADVEDGQLGEDCPICGEGPFTRLARHTTAKHDDAPIVIELDGPLELEGEMTSSESDDNVVADFTAELTVSVEGVEEE